MSASPAAPAPTEDAAETPTVTNDATLIIDLPTELKLWVRGAARRQDRSMQSFIRTLLFEARAREQASQTSHAGGATPRPSRD